MSKAAIRTPGAGSRWLFGPVPDLALGCGLLYGVFFVSQVVAGPGMRTWLPLSLLPFLTLLLGSPHYGATLLRVYGTRADRRRYFFFGVWVSLLVAAAFVAGLHVAWIGSLILTLYLTWSPWHYSAQNYGVAVLLLRRRGTLLDASTRRLLRSSFVLSYGLVFLSLHGATGASPQTAVERYEGSIYDLLSLGIPLSIRDPAMLLTLAAYLLCTIGAVARLTRAGGFQAAGPTLVLIGVQAVWFLLPASVLVWPGIGRVEPFAPEYRAYAFMWIAVGHFLQYLWITTYYAAAAEDRPGRALYLGKALLVGISIWALPALVFAPDLLGSLPYDLGLGLLAASVVNLHHFILDGVIWRLRDDRIALMLLGPLSERGPADRAAVASGAEPRGPIRRGATALGWAGAAVVLVAALVASWESLAGNRAAERGDAERYALAATRRAWLGRDSPEPHLHFGVEAMQAGDLERAHRELDRGMALHPTADLWRLAGELALKENDPERAFSAFEEAIALDPGSGAAYYQSGRILAEQGRLDEALERLERANALWPDTEPIRTLLLELRGRRGAGATPGPAAHAVAPAGPADPAGFERPGTNPPETRP
ncbi:MAG: tetratricopeptide repeat protein [Deltaproteobacteria bacterium]|nr:tetratricopeptide repeat protein [Deltaproteobacteria bacterium]